MVTIPYSSYLAGIYVFLCFYLKQIIYTVKTNTLVLTTNSATIISTAAKKLLIIKFQLLNFSLFVENVTSQPSGFICWRECRIKRLHKTVNKTLSISILSY